MEIKDLWKLENLRVLLVYLTLYIVGRSIYFIVIGHPFAYFETSIYQEMFRQTLELEIPMFILTILWPLILAVLNSLHPSLRLAPSLFYPVIALHATSCLVAAGILFFWDSETLVFGNDYSLSFPSMKVVASISFATMISSLVSVLIYRFRIRVFEQVA